MRRTNRGNRSNERERRSYEAFAEFSGNAGVRLSSDTGCRSRNREFLFSRSEVCRNVTSFDVTGIDPSLMLNPDDATAFVTGLTFTANGSFTGTQTPLTENVPEPGTIVTLVSGLAGILPSRRRVRGASAGRAASSR